MDTENEASKNVMRKVGARKREGEPTKSTLTVPQQKGERFYETWVMERPGEKKEEGGF